MAAKDAGPIRDRIELAASCRDADVIPKTPEAGSIVESAGERLQVMHNGLLVLEGAYHGAWMSEVIERLRGHHEPQEERVFHEILSHCRRGGVMLELGSFWAYYAMWFMRSVPESRAILVEPDSNNLEVGQRHLELNGLTAESVLAAVGASPSPPARFRRESDGEDVLVPRVSVDSVLSASDTPLSLELLLADVQGADLNVLLGAREAISDGRLRFVVLSTHHHSISGDPLTHSRCLDLIESLGGHVLAEHTVTESFSGDGLIAASFRDEDQEMRTIDISRARARDTVFGEVERDLAVVSEELRACRSERVALESKLASRGRGRGLLARWRGRLTSSLGAWRQTGSPEWVKRLFGPLAGG